MQELMRGFLVSFLKAVGISKHLFLHLFPGTAQREKSEQLPSSCRQSGGIKSCGSRWRKKAGRSQISKYGTVAMGIPCCGWGSR